MIYRIYGEYSYSESTGSDWGTDLIDCKETLEEAIHCCPPNSSGPNFYNKYYVCVVDNGKETVVWKQNEYKSYGERY